MVFIKRQEPFTCEHCGAEVQPLEATCRNHCPHCLYSKHVDDKGPGDRAATCHGLLKPIGLDMSSKKGWMVIFECEICSKRISNKAAPDDNLEQLVNKTWDEK